ncbi:MAG TPA: YafY family transcriptional regulator [Balneola sp.]|nr:transcriptional regulator [Balneola sp.]MAO76637.1 transcriptional regulator [Balneola sp.]MBF65044.1 transcriptional regulator [Balneola sp.]HAH52203.1 YafY family transcriptional regulator [Balneola sp.]HBZ40268.1 YafY family transcriptional regulator [Balneola sp.]
MLMLQQSKDRKTVQEFAEYFGVSKRTIFRDFNALQEINVPITWDKYSGYGVMPGFKIPPLMFSSHELATIIVGLNFVKSQVDARLVEDAKGVEVKIKNVLPDELKSFMESLQNKTIVDPYLKFGSEKKEGGNWYKISSAISQKKRIQFLYEAKSGEKKTRKVDPYLLVFYQDHWNMIGFSHLRGDFRNFILDRIRNIEILEEGFEPKKEKSVEDLIFRFDGTSEKVKVMLDNEVYKRFKANLPAKNFKKLKENAKKIKVSFEVDNLAFVNEWLLQYGNKIKIISPDELISKRKSLLKDMLEKN